VGAPAAQARPQEPPPEHVEEFTGLRIAKRCVDAQRWREEIRGKGRRVVPLWQVNELGQRARGCDRVLVGVLYDKANSEKLANGENFASWGITDLADPIPRLLKVQLRWEAYQHWRSRRLAPNATRGSLFAIMNPALVQEGKGCVWGSEPVIRVERASQLHKLGECPSLGRCDMKGCPLPCNADLGDRFCHKHLSRAYADKPGRIAAGGGAVTSAGGGTAPLSLFRRSGAAALGSRAAAAAAATADGVNEDPEGRDGGRTRARTDMAVQLDNRRFSHSEAKQNYIRSICSGARPDGHETSRVPVLGRGLEGSDGLEIDLATLDPDEQRKAQRMLEHHAERTGRGLLRAAAEAAPAAQPPAKKPRMAVQDQQLPAPRPALGQLLEALAVRRTARRAGAGAAAPAEARRGAAPGARGRPGPEAAERAGPAELAPAPAAAAPDAAAGDDSEQPAALRLAEPAPGPEATASAGQPPAPEPAETTPLARQAAEEMVRRLEEAGMDAEGVGAALQAAAGLPAEALEGEAGRRLYEAVGRLTLDRGRPEVRRQALHLRRRWRAQSDAATDGTLREVAAC